MGRMDVGKRIEEIKKEFKNDEKILKGLNDLEIIIKEELEELWKEKK